MTLAHTMMMALRAVRDGGHVTRAELYWLRTEFYIDEKHALTLKGHAELDKDDNERQDGKT